MCILKYLITLLFSFSTAGPPPWMKDYHRILRNTLPAIFFSQYLYTKLKFPRGNSPRFSNGRTELVHRQLMKKLTSYMTPFLNSGDRIKESKLMQLINRKAL